MKSDFAEAYSNLGNTLQELGRLDEAEDSYRQATALKPEYVEALDNLGTTLKELGRLEEAVARYSQAIALNPDFSEAYYNLGVLLFGSRRYNLAAEQFELSDIHQSKLFAIKCSYFQGKKSIFLKILFVSKSKRDQCCPRFIRFTFRA